MVRGLLVLLLFTLLSLAAGESSAKEAGVKIGSDIQHFTLKTLNPKLSGQRMVSSRHLIGTKAKKPSKGVGITFGASYCEPCKKELRVLAQQKEAIAKAGYTLLAVVIDKKPEGIEVMRKLLLDELKVTFPVLSDRFGILARRYKATSLPMMLVIEPAGKISWVHTGYNEKALGEFLSRLGVSKETVNQIKY